MSSSKLYSSALSEPVKEQEMPTANALGKDLEPSAPRISSHVEFPPLNSHAPSPLTACITPATPNILPSKSNGIALDATNFAPLVRDCENNYSLSATHNDVSQGVTSCHESDSNPAEYKPTSPNMSLAGYPPLTYNQPAPYPTPWPNYSFPSQATAPMITAVHCFGYYDPAFPPWAPWAPWNLPPFANGPPAPYGLGPKMPPTPQASYTLPYHYPPPSLPIPSTPLQAMEPITAPSSSQSMRKTRSRSRRSSNGSGQRRSSSVNIKSTTDKMTLTGSRRSSGDANTASTSATSPASFEPILSHKASRAKLLLRKGQQSTTPKRTALPKFTGPRPVVQNIVHTIEFHQNIVATAPNDSKDIAELSCECTKLKVPEIPKEDTRSSNVSWSQSKQWSSKEKKEIQAFQKMELGLRFMGADKSPFVPRSAAELAALRASIAESRKDKFAREVARRLRMIKRDIDTDEEVISPTEPPKLYAGKQFQDCLSALFSVTSCFCEDARQLKADAHKWPTIIELKEVKVGLPLPQDPEDDSGHAESKDSKSDAANFYSIQPVDDGFGSDIKNIDQAVLEQVPDFVKELVQYIDQEYSE